MVVVVNAARSILTWLNSNFMLTFAKNSNTEIEFVGTSAVHCSCLFRSYSYCCCSYNYVGSLYLDAYDTRTPLTA